MAKSDSDNIQHILTVDPKKEWADGWQGFFLRYRGIALATFIKAVASGTLFKYVGPVGGVFALAVGFPVVVWLCCWRYFLLKSMNADDRLHTLMHATRDQLPTILASVAENPASSSLDRFHHDCANRIAAYFQSILKNENIGCAIRVAEEVDGQRCYVTYGRSTGLESRKRTSKPLPADKGLAHILRDKESRGVLIVPNIKAAIQRHSWTKQENDDCDDIQSVMVAPINSIENGTLAMMGILYITSRDPVFKQRHASALKAFSDFLGLVYPVLYGIIPRTDTQSLLHEIAKPKKLPAAKKAAVKR